MTEPASYRFAPLSSRGLIAGVRTGQVVCIAGGLGGAVIVIRIIPAPGGVAMAVAAVLASAVAAFVVVDGRPVEAWAPVLLRHGGAVVAGRHRGRLSHRGAPIAPPRWLRRLRVMDVAADDGTVIGMVRDGETLAVVFDVRGEPFALLDDDEQSRRIDQWASVLNALAREAGPQVVLQWLHSTHDGETAALARHAENGRRIAADHPAAESYRRLVGAARHPAHRCLLVLAVTTRSTRRRRRMGAFAGEVALLQAQLRAAGIDLRRALEAREIGAAVRVAFDPCMRFSLGRGSSLAAAWPAATDTLWGSYRTDTTCHATYWVAEWPRSNVGPDFLTPFLIEARCTLSLSMAPVPPLRGARAAEAARTAIVADAELRRHAGFLDTARQQRAAEATTRTEAELSAGHAPYRYAAYVTVSAPDGARLERSCAEVMQIANRCSLDLRRLYGVQDLAFTWTLPLGRGLPARGLSNGRM